MATAVLSPGWTASPARTLSLALPAGSALRGVRTAAGPLSFVGKSAADALDFALDASALLSDGGDALAGGQATVPVLDPSTDLQVLWCTILSGQLVVFLAGGAPGSTTTIQLLLVTTAGRRRIENVQIQIDENSLATAPVPAPQLELPAAAGTVPIPPNAVTLPDGSILTDSSGQPYLLA